MVPKLCGFNSLRCMLTVLNGFYITIGLFLIGLVIAAHSLSYFTYVPILVGIAVCGTLVVAVAVMGLIGTIKHHQVILFFYMVVLCLSFLVLFAVSVTALATPSDFQESLFEKTWRGLGTQNKVVIQEQLNCCGFNLAYRNFSYSEDCPVGHPVCNTTALVKENQCCYDQSSCYEFRSDEDGCRQEFTCPGCSPCYSLWEHEVSTGVWGAGSFGLIFSFTMIIGVVLTFFYRHSKDPKANPSAFL